ncbi:MAG TPA: ImmA/IrrE family metallo-endopeptidase [Gammaproteobacteria bacterium]|nr:ImmA/IrrE family metallo-endopeptidase [Gammaproteobacteria bacterium]
MLTPCRLSLARKRRRLTKKALAEFLGITPHTVLRYESGEICPPDDVVKRISKFLNFPEAFFSADEIEELSTDAASFRSLSSTSAKDRDAALAAGTIAFLFADWVEERFGLPQEDLIDLSDEEPEVAARSLRQKWGLGERPVRNMVHLLEAKGVRVFSLAENTKTVDAFSVWRAGKPYIFLNVFKTPERSRFDAAHELGHLVLHRHGGPYDRGTEKEADRFASSFLMPSADVLAITPRVRHLRQIVQAKRRWAVSVFALIYRLHALGIITDWHYRTFCIQATEYGYRDNEPNGIAREQSLVWRDVLTELWRERVRKDDIARALGLPSLEIENLLFGLANTLRTEKQPTIPYEQIKLALV